MSAGKRECPWCRVGAVVVVSAAILGVAVMAYMVGQIADAAMMELATWYGGLR